MRSYPLRLLTVAALTLALASCLSPAGLTDARGRPTDVARDTLGPTSTVSGSAALSLEVGDSIAVEVHDTGVVRKVLVFAEDSTARVVWRSDTMRVAARHDTLAVPFQVAGEGFPFEATLRFVVWAQDSSGNGRYSGAPDTAQLTRRLATARLGTVYRGHTISVGSGGGIGAAAYDLGRRLAFVADSVRNHVRGLDVETGRWQPWSVPLGSRPAAIALRTTIAGTTAYLLNNGGTELSVVDAPAGGTPRETTRWVLPVQIVRYDTIGYRVAFPTQTLLFWCPDATCMAPSLFIGTSAYRINADTTVPANMQQVGRTFDLSAPDPMRAVQLVAPLFSTQVVADTATDAVLAAVDRASLVEDTLGTYIGASRCATRGAGTAMAAVGSDPGSSLFLGFPPAKPGCHSLDNASAQMVRVDRLFGQDRLSGQGLLNTAADRRLMNKDRIAVNADGSRVALTAGNTLFLTDGTFRLLGTITIGPDDITAVTFLANSRVRDGTPTRVAVATTREIVVVDGDSYRVIHRARPRKTVMGPLLFTPSSALDQMTVAGLLQDRTAMWTLQVPRAAAVNP